MKNAAKLVLNKLPQLRAAVSKLGKLDVLVGVPSDDPTRKDDGPMNNATLAYIHDNGSAAANIPARPFMKPGVENAKDGIVRNFKAAGKDALHGGNGMEVSLNRAGLLTQSSIRAVINAGIGPALADSTLKGRIRSRRAIKGAEAELASRAEGNAPGIDLAKPLVMTGQLRNSINYVVRKKA